MDFDFQFEAPKGTRVLGRLGCGITHFRNSNRHLWWIPALQKWLDDDALDALPRRYDHGSHAPCRSFKAFKRPIRKHHEELKGCEVIFVHRFIGHNVKVML